MKTTGMVRKIDELGRICLPIELRRTLNIDVSDSVEIFTDGDKIVLRKYNPGCMLCGSMDIKVRFGGAAFCGSCAETIAKAVRV